MGQIIAVANQKGGTGKTTTSVNIAAYLACEGRTVLLVDIDPQGNASSGVGQEKEPPTIYEVLTGECSMEEAIRKTDICKTLDVVVSNNDLSGIEIELIGRPRREFRLNEVLSEIKDNYDIVILDCPPALSLLTVMAMTTARYVLIPVQAEFYALEGLAQLINTIELIKQRLNPSLEILGVLLTMVDKRTNLSASVEEEVRNVFKNKCFSSTIPRNVRLSEAPSFGKPILLYDPNCPGAIAYQSLVKEILSALGK